MSRKIMFGSLLLVVIAIGLLHFFTPGELGVYHGTYRRLSYFPIVMGGIWFGIRGGLFFSVLSSVAFIPHLLLYIGDDPRIYLNELLEVVLYIAAGTVTGFIASREARLRVKYQNLSEKLEESYKKLHRESAMLLEVEEQLGESQKFSALGKLSASLAHEIKNPLSSIRGTAEIILDEFPADHPKREFGEILLKEVDRLNVTLSEILQYSSGKARHDREAQGEPLHDVLHRVSRLLETHLKKKKVSFVISSCENCDTFLVDGNKMSQVFLNIILNAIDVLPEKGEIRLDVRSEEDCIEISICDNGPGVPREFREEIFKPFVSGKDHGSGLGLSISAKIVESYGGRIVLTESVSGGACFTVVLPWPEDDEPGGNALDDQ
ncbi:MAG: sensor histidine kinase [Proteobacteria bacterium]|nr:sensor histidine kinase [Pseudomonadota bacterium]MBU1739108.1 sensor histidine kinase [Pseudomonadota bacterium]